MRIAKLIQTWLIENEDYQSKIFVNQSFLLFTSFHAASGGFLVNDSALTVQTDTGEPQEF